MKPLPILLSVSILGALTHAAEASTTLTFDDVSPFEYVLIPNGYHGFQWNNFFIENATNSPGFDTGAVSQPNVAFDGLGNPASISSGSPFTLESAYLTAVYVDLQQIRVQGFTGGIQNYDNTYTITGSAPTLVNFNYAGVDQVRFTITASPNGIFAMDDLVVGVPEPGTCALVLLATFLRGWFSRKKSQS